MSAHILIVDDNADAAMSLLMLFELEGLTAMTAADGPSALKLAAATPPRVMLIDIGLPGMNGFELARTLRSNQTAAALIAITGRAAGDADDPDVRLFDQFWTKPIDPKKLLSEVKAILSSEPTRA